MFLHLAGQAFHLVFLLVEAWGPWAAGYLAVGNSAVDNLGSNNIGPFIHPFVVGVKLMDSRLQVEQKSNVT